MTATGVFCLNEDRLGVVEGGGREANPQPPQRRVVSVRQAQSAGQVEYGRTQEEDWVESTGC